MIHAKVSPADCKSYLSEIKSLPPFAKTSDEVNRMVRCSTLDAIQTMAIRENEAVALLEVEPELEKLGLIANTFGLQTIDWITAMKLPTYSERASTFAKIDMQLNTRTSLNVRLYNDWPKRFCLELLHDET